MSTAIAFPDDEPQWVPAFPRQRPPFAKGNDLAVKHGINSMALVRPIADEFIATLQTDPALAYLAQPRFAAAVDAWAIAEAKVVLINEYMAAMNSGEAIRNDRGQKSVTDQADTLAASAERARGRLGLDPLSAARLGKDVAQGQQASLAVELTKWRAEQEGTTPPPTPQK